MNKRFILGLAAAIGIFAQGAAAQDMAFFRIGTGGTAGPIIRSVV